jgi:peptidyl-prolyl cis-trans isomerase C
VQAAEDLRLDGDPEFQTVMSEARRQLLAQFYYDHVLRAAAVPDSTDIQRYYDEHPEQFTVAERVGARQIVLATEAEAGSVREALVAGASFDSLLERSVDDLTRPLGGSLGVVSYGAPVRGIGRNDAFVESLMALEVGAVSEPIKTPLGYHVVQIESHDPERKRPLAAVRESLTRRVEVERLRSLSQAAVDSLRAAKEVTIHQEVLLGEDAFRARRAEELFSRAQDTDDARERLTVYAQIADEFPESKHAAQAQFMRGFILIEELDDKQGGRRELERLLAEHPESELVDSARWMLENIDSDAEGAEGANNVGSDPPED